MTGDFLDRARQFARTYEVTLGEELGAGTQGVVFTAIGNAEGAWTALKVHFSEPSFRRERAIYRLLFERGVTEVAGFAVPRFHCADEALLAIEMSIVRPPYVLDFAGAAIGDEPPEFSENVWTEWEKEKIEQFGPR